MDMERDHRFTVRLPEAAYVVALFENVEFAPDDGGVTGRWPAFDLSTSGADEAEVLQQMLAEVPKRFGVQGRPEYEPFADYVRTHGTRLSAEESAARDLDLVRGLDTRWRVTDDEQYTVRLWQDAELTYGDDHSVTMTAFGLEGSGARLTDAVKAMTKAVSQACGKHDAPGPRFDELTAWVRAHGEPVAAEVLATERAAEQAYVDARDKLTAITPEDIASESSTGVPLLVDFWAAWCAPCRMVTPVLAELAETWAGRILVRKIDVDQFDGIWDRFNFRGIPAMVVFKDGEEVHRIIGFGGKKHLMAELEPLL